ncbi:hypothetical protein [Anatilimnocola aggregata]|nr:hypothetical protein [Anatilimnocola aggregata]
MELDRYYTIPPGFPFPTWGTHPKDIGKMRRDQEAWAMCGATLFPWVNPKMVPVNYRGPLPRWVPKYAAKLYNLRAIQLVALDRADCRRLPDKTFCPPSFVNTDAKHWTCKSLWCPFCWGRLVAAAQWQRMRKVGPYYFARQQLLEAVNTQYVEPFSQPLENIRLLLSGACKALVATLGAAKSPGTLRLAVLEPTTAGWKVEARVLAFVPLNFTEKCVETASPGLSVVYHRTYGKKHEMAKLVGRHCEYPFGLLTRPAAEVKQVLELREGLRLMSSTGVFRATDSSP